MADDGAVKVRLLFEPHDIWIGLYWVHDVQGWDGGWWEGWRFYVCPLPMIVIKATVDRSNKPTRAYKRWQAGAERMGAA